MKDIRKYIDKHLIEPLKNYTTGTQNALLEIIKERLEELYEYTIAFPEIVYPSASRLDILQAIIEQFQFSIRNEADIYEQIDILNSILHVYRKRGSVDTIENMWKYYGGDLPRDIKVNIPAQNLFRYNISKFSGKHVYVDVEEEGKNRPGITEVILTNSHYPIDKLKEFMMEELVAAGTSIYFTNNILNELIESSAYKYNYFTDYYREIFLEVASYNSGMKFSSSRPLYGRNPEDPDKFIPENSRDFAYWSGTPNIMFESVYMLDISGETESNTIDLSTYKLIDELGVLIDISSGDMELFAEEVMKTLQEEYISRVVQKDLSMSYTPLTDKLDLERYLYDKGGNLLESLYPGYFVLGNTLLGNEVI